MLAVPGDGLLHPAVLAAISLLILNDHVLKPIAPGVVTGKLSDLAGLLFFPLLLVAAWEVGTATVTRWRGPTRRPLVLAVVATCLAFIAVKTLPAATSLFSSTLGWIQWLAAVVVHWFGGTPAPAQWAVAVAQDPTDLVALVSLVAASVIGYHRVGDLRTSTEDAAS